MKFDGSKYLEKIIRQNFDLNDHYVGLYYKNIFDDENAHISYGSLEFEKKGEYRYLKPFCPKCDRDIVIDSVEIGNKNRFSKYTDHRKDECLALITASFKGSRQNIIKCIIDFDRNNDRIGKASIVINDNTSPYKGIYYIDMQCYDKEEYKPMLMYFDDKTLDTLHEYHNEEVVSRIIGIEPVILEDSGFLPDKTKMFEKEEVCGKYGCYQDAVTKVFTKGSQKAFEKWIDKAFKKEDEKELKKQPFQRVLG